MNVINICDRATDEQLIELLGCESYVELRRSARLGEGHKLYIQVCQGQWTKPLQGKLWTFEAHEESVS